MNVKSCKICSSKFHQAYRCPDNPKVKESFIKTKNKMIEKQIKKQIAKSVSPKLITSKKSLSKKKKLTMREVNAKIAAGKALTKADQKLRLKNQKDKSWKSFSTYIRTRDCLATTGTTEYGMCVTCMARGDNTQYPYSRIQAGHGVGGRRNAVLFHEEIVNGQCDHDNRQGMGGLAGDYGNYMIHFVRKYGLEHAEYLQSLKYADKQYSFQDLVDIEQKYKDKLKLLTEK